MDFQKYRRLKRAVLKAGSFEDFIRRVAKQAHWLGVPLWNRENYRWFFERIKGGAHYVDIIAAAA